MSSYSNIAKTTGIIAIAKISALILGFLKNKVIAIILGTPGMGFFSLLNSIETLGVTVCSLGLPGGSVREIASVTAEDREREASKIFTVLLYILGIFSTFGIIGLIIFSKQISLQLFQTQDLYWSVIVVAPTLWFLGLSNLYLSIFNGMRKIKDFSYSQIFSGIIGSTLGCILVWLGGQKAIPWSILLTAVSLTVCIYFFFRKINIRPVLLDRKDFFDIFKRLITIGMVFFISDLAFQLTAYMSRIFIAKKLGIGTVGIFQSCWTISNLYIGILLSSMGIDFLPRIMEFRNEHQKLVKSINEQMELCIALGLLGILGCFIFTQLLLQILYSKAFLTGESIMRWQLLGVLMRILGFPFGYALIAKEKFNFYIVFQVVFYFGEFALLVLFVKLLGFNGLGISYPLAYSFYVAAGYLTCRNCIGYRPSKNILMLLGISILFMGGALLLRLIDSAWIYYSVGLGWWGACVVIIACFLAKEMKINFFTLLKRKLHLSR